MEQLRKIYTGAYDNWSQVGGLDRRIVVFSRDSSSGTFVYFQEHVLNETGLSLRRPLCCRRRRSIVQSVSRDEGAIGYVGLGYAAGCA